MCWAMLFLVLVNLLLHFIFRVFWFVTHKEDTKRMQSKVSVSTSVTLLDIMVGGCMPASYDKRRHLLRKRGKSRLRWQEVSWEAERRDWKHSMPCCQWLREKTHCGTHVVRQSRNIFKIWNVSLIQTMSFIKWKHRIILQTQAITTGKCH